MKRSIWFFSPLKKRVGEKITPVVHWEVSRIGELGMKGKKVDSGQLGVRS